MVGEVVTHYRILEKIGEGGMGVVYRAEDTRLGRHVAVKFLSATLSSYPDAVERFEREARAASALSNPHICAVYDVGQHGQLPFLVMELLDGETLRRRIDGRPLPIDLVLEYAVQIADALEAAHAQKIIHRDIKSANIFVTARGQIKVLDFGLAKLAPGLTADPYSDTTRVAEHSPQATAAGQTLGTLAYMSPEQARGEDLDARSDLFSFGALLYEMATGRDAFTGKTSALIFDAILNQTPPPAGSINPLVPAELDHTIDKALEKDRTTRYQSAAEMRADLKRIKRATDSGRTVATLRAALPRTSATGVASPSRRSFVLAAGAAALVVGLAAAGYAIFGARGGTIDSVAVLPFAMAGGSGDAEYLTDGITETLINGLTQLPGLRVSARSVVFKYKNKQPDSQQAGRDLNVKAVVTGHVSVRGDRLVIQAELVNVADGSQMWGDQYNRPTSDLLAVQDEIAREILDKIQPRLSGEERERVTKRHTDDAVAYQTYLQGRYHWNKGTVAGYKKAIDYFQQAIAKDPKYALAYAGLADSYLLLGSYFVEAVTEAKGAAEEALRLDPNLAEAHIAVGHIKLLLDWDWPAAEKSFTTGLSLNPSSALAHSQYAMYLATVGRVPEAIVEVTRARDLDPLSPIVNSDLGWYLLYGGRVSEAVAQFRSTLEFDANSVSAHRGLGLALSQQGEHEDALAHLKRALELSEQSPVVIGHIGAAEAAAGNRAGADAALKNLEALSARQYVPSTAMATIATALGDRARALGLLEKAYEEHDFAISQIGVAPWFAPLRGEPRFVTLLEKLGLPK
ncbi:MAG TPA: protein kinase [Vicinamibacterales bacterium]|nr:protein kinase [Vicinamibacterales bacterium]